MNTIRFYFILLNCTSNNNINNKRNTNVPQFFYRIAHLRSSVGVWGIKLNITCTSYTMNYIAQHNAHTCTQTEIE